MKKILFIHPGVNPLNEEGAQHRLRSFAESTDKIGLDVNILLFVPILHWIKYFKIKKKLDNSYDWYIFPSFSFFSNELIGVFSRFYAQIVVWIIVKFGKFHLVQCEMSSTTYLTKFCKQIKIIADFHADLAPELDFKGEGDTWKKRAAKNETEYALKHADCIISVSKNLESHLRNSYNEDFKCVFQPCTVDFSRFKSSFDERMSLRRDLDISDNKIVLGYLGGLQQWQCIEETLELVARLKRKGLDLFFCLFTNDDCSKYNTLLDEIGVEGSDYLVKSLKREDVPNYTSVLDFGMLLRENKTINLVASPTKGAEYLAAGAGVITTPFSGNVPDLIENSDCGIILKGVFPTDSELDKTINSINLFMEHRLNMFDLSKSLVDTEFDWELSFSKISNIYKV